MAVGQPASGQVVRGDIDIDDIADQDVDFVLSHLSGEGGEHDVFVFEFDFEGGVGQGVDNNPFEGDGVVVFGHGGGRFPL